MFSDCLAKVHFKSWHMHTDERVRHVHLRHLCIHPVSMNTIDLMNTVFCNSDLNTKLVSIGHAYTHAPIEWIDLDQAT